MSPEGFLQFRDPLDPASGFQSFQFRAIEFLSGGGKKAMLSFEIFDDDQRAWLKEMSEVPSVWSGFEHSLRVDDWRRERRPVGRPARAVPIARRAGPERAARRRGTPDGPRRPPRGVATRSHADGRSTDRSTSRHRRQRRHGLSRYDVEPASLPGALGSTVHPVITREDCQINGSTPTSWRRFVRISVSTTARSIWTATHSDPCRASVRRRVNEVLDVEWGRGTRSQLERRRLDGRAHAARRPSRAADRRPARRGTRRRHLDVPHRQIDRRGPRTAP